MVANQKPRSNNQTSRSLPVSTSSCVTSNGVPLVDHFRNSSSFSDSKHFVCSTCQKCVFNANHEGYRNTIELPVGNNVVPLRSDTIRLVQNVCSFHGLWSEDPNQHLKDFLKLMDTLDLDGENRERTRLRLFQFSLRDQVSNWTAKLRNDILTFQQHHGESLFEAWTRFKDLLQKVPHQGIDLWHQVQIFYDHVTPVTRRTIDQLADGKLRDRNAEES
ncbi:zinc finger, CCHC-type containing protein [Tanacetum coccineum]